MWVAEAQVFEPLTLPPNIYISMEVHWKERLDSNPRTPVWNMGIPTSDTLGYQTPAPLVSFE